MSINKLIFPIIDKHPSHNLCDSYFLSTEARDITSSFIFFFYPFTRHVPILRAKKSNHFQSICNPVDFFLFYQYCSPFHAKRAPILKFNHIIKRLKCKILYSNLTSVLFHLFSILPSYQHVSLLRILVNPALFRCAVLSSMLFFSTRRTVLA